MKLTTHPLGPDLDLPRISIDRELAARLRNSFAAIVPMADLFAAKFYARLFTVAPAVRPMFPLEMHEQRAKLLAMLQWIVKNLEDRPQLKTGLRELGRRHEHYGARQEHYPVVADVMIATMAEVAGPAWNEQSESDWRTVLERVCAIMLGRP